MKKKKIKEIKLPMKFNPGTQKYEPILPLKKSNQKLNVQMSLRDKIIGIISLILIIIFLIILAWRYSL